MEAGQANKVKGHVGLVEKLKFEDSAQTEELRKERARILDYLFDSGTLINSIWAYRQEGNTHHDAPVLMSPQRFGVNSGQRTLKISEWVRSDQTDGPLKDGSGHPYGLNREIHLAIFTNMVMNGSVELVYPGPKPTNEE